MHASGEVAQADRSDGQALDHAALAVDHRDVADIDRAFHQDEGAGDHILHQALRAKAERQADHAGAGEQRRDVDPQFGKDDERRQDADRDEEHVAHERQQGADSRGADQGVPVAVGARQIGGDGAVPDLPGQQGEERDEDDGGQMTEYGSADGAAQNGADIDPPGRQHGEQRAEAKGIEKRQAQRREIEVGAPRDRRKARENPRVHCKKPVEAARDPAFREQEQEDHRRRQDRRAQKIGEAARNAQGPDDIERDQIGRGDDMPNLAQSRAEGRRQGAQEGEGPRSPPQRRCDCLPVLQDEDDEQHRDEQAKNFGGGQMNGGRHAEQCASLKDEVAPDDGDDEPPGPDIEIGGCVVGKRREPQGRRERIQHKLRQRRPRERERDRIDDGE